MIKAPAMQGFLNEESKKVCVCPLLNVALVFFYANNIPYLKKSGSID